MPVFESPGLSGGECRAVSDKLGDSVNRECAAKGSIEAALLVLLWSLICRGTRSMLTFRLEIEDDDCRCWSNGGDEPSEVRFGDVGEAALLLRVCAIGVDADLIGDAGLCAEAAGPGREVLVMERERVDLELDDSTDPEAVAKRFGLVVNMDVELEGGLMFRGPSAVVPFA